MKKLGIFLSLALLGIVILTGCGKNNPSAPSIASSEETTLTTQTFKPGGIIYEAQLCARQQNWWEEGAQAEGTVAGYKPYYWFDGIDNPAFNAEILINLNSQSSTIRRTNAGTTWGKVHTFAIECSGSVADAAIRIFVPSHSTSVAWKLVIQEEGGAWRNWVLQNSTGYTGYKDYDFNAIFAEVKTGSGKFIIEVVLEGSESEWIELAELYVFDKAKEHEAYIEKAYWYESFDFASAFDYHGYTGPTPGWFDERNTPGSNGQIRNQSNRMARIRNYPNELEGGKVMSPVIPWDPDYCQKLIIDLTDSTACFSIWIQEQRGSYRQWQIPRTAGETGTEFTYDLTTVTELAKGDPFSVTIADVFGSIWMNEITIKKNP